MRKALDTWGRHLDALIAHTPLLPVFTRWCDCQFHSMLLDLVDEPLIEEEV